MPLLSAFSPAEARELSARFENAEPVELLRWAWNEFGSAAAIGTSFQGAGLVILNEARRAGLPLPVFTIDTGLLFPQTVELKQRLEDFFQIEIEVLRPEQTPDEQAADLGPRLWERNPDLCCTLRKVIPLQRKLASLSAWITGLRRSQSSSRAEIEVVELYPFDPIRDLQIVKLNPIANWTAEQVWEYVRQHRIPYNPLRDSGFRSIGCEPCTRAVGGTAGERAGRWIGFEKTECGIHTFLGAKLV
ncbi:MAG: phosphoadenylyl-sulfate reductase [Verrucomicrobia bacterium]|nr:phosphoadenylyl-sulfate reductase [Verrucomicrobiota bacterium]